MFAGILPHHTHFYPRSPCGERLIWVDKTQSAPNFYPRSPCGERPWDLTGGLNCNAISIHALLAESDARKPSIQVQHLPFLSTLSLRRATAPNRRPCPRSKISIHALLAESDFGVRWCHKSQMVFLSTLSLRRATWPYSSAAPQPGFLSTLSLRRATLTYSLASASLDYFYPRSPCGERRTDTAYFHDYIYDFYPRSPCGERR